MITPTAQFPLRVSPTEKVLTTAAIRLSREIGGGTFSLGVHHGKRERERNASSLHATALIAPQPTFTVMTEWKGEFSNGSSAATSPRKAKNIRGVPQAKHPPHNLLIICLKNLYFAFPMLKQIHKVAYR